MERPWRPLTAGILNMVAGVGVLFVCFWLVLAGGITSVVGNVPQWVPALLFGLAIPFALLAILSVVGGIFAVQRKAWGFSLAGSIAAFFCCFVLGVISLILIAISRSEFK
ncbi:MAG: hypothetical protein EHM12_05035 [Dehalococcoidia bacterium]|nr:MAG: hypothetical protein EHM12_05035 [Dehalococcoidia bacterium]